MMKKKSIKILGIDPGIAITGYCVLEAFEGDEYSLITSGSIQTSQKSTVPERLKEIQEDVSEIIKSYPIDVAAIEQLFYFKNAKTVINVAQARGVILAQIANAGLNVFEYTPLVVKQVIAGYGRATKKEIEESVKLYLKNKTFSRLDDTIDSVAIAICHARNIIL